MRLQASLWRPTAPTTACKLITGLVNRIPPRESQTGFVLIDVLLVAIIVGIMVAIVTPQFQSMLTQTRLNEAAVELISALQYAGDLAVTYQRPFALSADTAGNWFKVIDYRYKGDGAPHHDADPPVKAQGVVLNPTDKTWYLKDYDTLSSFQGVSLTTVPAGGEICFYPDGHSAATNQTFVLSFDGRQRTITVDGVTGRITVQ